MITAQQESAYRCFLPDLAGLGSACSHGSWREALYVITQSMNRSTGSLPGSGCPARAGWIVNLSVSRLVCRNPIAARFGLPGSGCPDR